MDNTSSIKLIERRVIRGNKHVIKLILVWLGGHDYRQTMGPWVKVLVINLSYILLYSMLTNIIKKTKK